MPFPSLIRRCVLAAILFASLPGCSAEVAPDEEAVATEGSEALVGQGPRFLGVVSSGSLCPPGVFVATHNPYGPAPLSIIVNRAAFVDAPAAQCTFSVTFELPPGYRMPALNWSARGGARSSAGSVPYFKFQVSNAESGTSTMSRQTMGATLDGDEWSGNISSAGLTSSNCSGTKPKKVTWTLQLGVEANPPKGLAVLIDSFDAYTTAAKKCSP